MRQIQKTCINNKYPDPTGNVITGGVTMNLGPDVLGENRRMRIASERAWQEMKAQVGSSSQTGSLMLMLMGFSGIDPFGTSGGGGGAAPAGGDVGPESNDGGNDGDVVKSECGRNYSTNFSFSEGVGIFGGFFVDYSFLVTQVNANKFYATVIASAYAPVVEMMADRVTYSARAIVYNAKGEQVSSETLDHFFDKGPWLTNENFTSIGTAYDSISPGYYVKLIVTYCAYSSWQGNYSPSVPFTKYFYF